MLQKANHYARFVARYLRRDALAPSNLAFLFRHTLHLLLLRYETSREFARHYGPFTAHGDLRRYQLPNPAGEGGTILGAVVYFAARSGAERPGARLLLCGDRNATKAVWAQRSGFATIITAGIHPEMDVYWDLDDEPPETLGRFDAIVSQAMLEHLTDPFGHLRKLAGLLAPGGHVVIHSVLPGFFYHRFPIDCARFYPDWFEESARKLQLRVFDKHIQAFNIVYDLQRPAASTDGA